MREKTLAISLGDIRGIGPEITLKALVHELSLKDGWRYIVYGDLDFLRNLNEKLCLGCSLESSQITVRDTAGAAEFQEPALRAVSWLKGAAAACMANEADAMVTAPVNKEEIILAGYHHFTGQTEYLSELARTQDTAMMLMGQADGGGPWLRIVLATTHVRVSALAKMLSVERVERAIRRAADACRLLRIPRSRIGVSAFNPHAGEGGKMGDEEQRLILPAIEICRKSGIEAEGPIPADAILRQAWKGEFDVIVSMYHDQALPALKMVAFDTGINWTLGLPFIRVSPDHGTAFNIAERGIASSRSMICAIEQAKLLCKKD